LSSSVQQVEASAPPCHHLSSCFRALAVMTSTFLRRAFAASQGQQLASASLRLQVRFASLFSGRFSSFVVSSACASFPVRDCCVSFSCFQGRSCCVQATSGFGGPSLDSAQPMLSKPVGFFLSMLLNLQAITFLTFPSWTKLAHHAAQTTGT